MSTKKLINALGLIIVVALLAAALPLQAKAQTGGNTLYVAEWENPVTLENVTGRETVLFDGTNYHMWYSSSDEKTLYHTSSNTPAGLDAVGTEVTFSGAPSGAPAEVGSVSVVKEGSTFYMIAYGADNQEFAIYTSADGTAWTFGGVIFEGSVFTDYNKIDGPYLFLDGSTYRFYFQVKTTATNPQYYHIYLAEATGTLASIADGNSDVDYTLNSTNPVLSPGGTGWDAEQVMQPWVVKVGDVYYMWYSGWGTGFSQQVGMAKSDDGYTWVKRPGNPIFVPATGYAEPSVITDGENWQMWTMGTGGVINYLTATGPFEFSSIQDAIDAASDGDVIEVSPGTYNENITINKAGITLQSTGTAEETIINANEGFGVYILKDLGTVTIDGFTVKGWVTAGIVQVTANREGTISRILNNIVIGETGDEDHGNCIQVTGDNSLIEGNTVTGAYYIGTGPYGASGILVYAANDVIVRNNTVSGADIGISVAAGAYQSPGNLISGVLVEDNEVSNSEIGISVSFNAKDTLIKDNFVHGNQTGLFEEFKFDYGPTGTVALHNRIVDNVEQAMTGATDDTPIPEDHVFTAEENWWGSIAGPGASQISGEVDFTPWCTNEGCTTFAPGEDDVVELSGSISVPGGILINEPGITYHLAADTVIQNDSPCFVVNASDTSIIAEPGAKCIPTDGSNGSDVAAGLTDIRVEGLEIDGSDLTGSGDGIHFAGSVNGVHLVSNNIHDLDGDAIEFATAPTGSVTIAFNRLYNNGSGIKIPDISTDSVEQPSVIAENNWWGSSDGPAAGSIIGDVDYDPWLVLKITSEKQIVEPDEEIQIDANLIYNSAGQNTLSDG